jgi:peptidoglycan hydrolase-like protein with peptidoglycan-binding domain
VKAGSLARVATASVIGASTIAGVQIVNPATASANTLYPSGCQTTAYDNPYGATPNWGWNCYVGYSYVNNAQMVVGVQNVLQSFALYGGALDGQFGSGTFNALKSYQQAKGLNQDGVCGPSTWKNLQTELHANGSDMVWDYFTSGFGTTGNRFRYDYQGTGRYQTGNIFGVWVWMDV